LRILSLCHEHPPVGGGAAAVCAALAKQAVAAGHSVVVITMAWRDLPEHEERDGYELYRIASGRKKKEMASPLEGLRWARRAWPLVRRLHAEEPFDVAHAHFIMPAGILAARLKRSTGVPFVITSHGSDVPGYNRERLKLAHVLARPWWKQICRTADQVVGSSAGQVELIHRVLPELRATAIPNGMEPGRFRPLEKERRILLCSRLVERKGFHYFLDAVRDLDAPGWEIDLVGDGPLRARIEALAEQCKIPVHTHGWIDNEDPRLAELYGRAMIYMFPSEWENFPLSLLEAMSAGCAIVTTDVSGNPEVVGDAGLLVPPRDVSALREATEQLTSDPERCRQLGRCAFERLLALFTWEAVGRKYLEELERHAAQGLRLEA